MHIDTILHNVMSQYFMVKIYLILDDLYVSIYLAWVYYTVFINTNSIVAYSGCVNAF